MATLQHEFDFPIMSARIGYFDDGTQKLTHLVVRAEYGMYRLIDISDIPSRVIDYKAPRPPLPVYVDTPVEPTDPNAGSNK